MYIEVVNINYIQNEAIFSSNLKRLYLFFQTNRRFRPFQRVPWSQVADHDHLAVTIGPVKGPDIDLFEKKTNLDRYLLQSNISGFVQSYGLKNGDNVREEFVKPIMFSGGIGYMPHDMIKKNKPEKGK